MAQSDCDLDEVTQQISGKVMTVTQASWVCSSAGLLKQTWLI